MIDIADKIYAATGLTLGAEAAAAIERLIQAENEKLRAENAKLAASNHAYLSDYQEAADEIEKMRAALRQIGKGDICVALLSHPPMCSRAFAARSALGEKECKETES